MRATQAVIIAFTVVLGAGVACSRQPEGTSATATPPTASAGAPYSNGWSDADRRAAYHLSTGGEILSLALLQSLERGKVQQEGADGQLVPFMQNLERYGVIPDPVSDENPFGLPVGWTVARSLLDTTVVAGFSCTTCMWASCVSAARRSGLTVRPTSCASTISSRT